MTNGFRSTEFWHSAACAVTGIALCFAGLIGNRDVLACAGAVILAVSSFGYSHSRGKAKTPRPYLTPQGRI